MSLTYLVFENETTADTAQAMIWENMIDEVLTDERCVYDAPGNLYCSMSEAVGIPRDQLRLPGYCCGERTQEGETTYYSIPLKKYLGTQWYMRKPADEYMAGVTDYIEEEYSPTWEPPMS